MNIKDISKQTNELSENQLDLFILQSFKEIMKKDKVSIENFDEVFFIQKFDGELKKKLKLALVASLDRKITDKDVSFKVKQISEILLSEFNRINNEISVEKNNIFRKEIINSGSDIDEKLKFYYDETNNPRKFWIKQNKFNSPVNKNFVLGGIVFDENKFTSNPDDLKDKLRLQKYTKEIKSNMILKSTFIESLKSKKLNIFLKWISENEIYIHFINVDNLHAIVNDILKIIINKNIDSDEARGLEFMHGHTLYKLMSSNIDKVCEVLTRYDYPKIQKEVIKDFCEDWISFLKCLKANLAPPKNKIDEIGRMIMFDELSKLFDEMKNGSNFVGLGKNEYIIKDYSNYYLIKPDIFLNSFHTYDREKEIEKIINTMSDIDFRENRNFTFRESHEDNFIQISDVVVGLLGRFFTYIEELNRELENGKIIQQLVSSLLKLNSIQKENFLLLTNILKKSHDKNKLFFYSENTFVQKNNLDLILRVIDITDEMVKFKGRNRV